MHECPSGNKELEAQFAAENALIGRYFQVEAREVADFRKSGEYTLTSVPDDIRYARQRFNRALHGIGSFSAGFIEEIIKSGHPLWGKELEDTVIRMQLLKLGGIDYLLVHALNNKLIANALLARSYQVWQKVFQDQHESIRRAVIDCLGNESAVYFLPYGSALIAKALAA